MLGFSKLMFIKVSSLTNVFCPDAPDGGVSREHRCSEKSRGRAERRRGYSRTHQPQQHRCPRIRSGFYTLIAFRCCTSSCSRRLTLSFPFRCDWTVGVDPGSVSQWETQAAAGSAAVAATAVRSAEHESMAGARRGRACSAARACP